jgi:hypothetical protein
MKRHKWLKNLKELENSWTEQHQCEKCKLYRIKVMGSWRYSKEKTTDDNPFVETIMNEGCG